jgi:hypothetical protein
LFAIKDIKDIFRCNGVAAALIRKGGAIIQQESNEIGFVPIGSELLL